MALSRNAEKLLAWFGLYKISATDYEAQLATHPKAQRHGAFVAALAELVENYY